MQFSLKAHLFFPVSENIQKPRRRTPEKMNWLEECPAASSKLQDELLGLGRRLLLAD